MTPLIRQLVNRWAEAGNDPAEAMWFDVDNLMGVSTDREAKQYLIDYCPPFEKSIIVTSGVTSKSKLSYVTLITLVGRDPKEGVFFSGWSGVNWDSEIDKWPLMWYKTDEKNELHSGIVGKNDELIESKEMSLQERAALSTVVNLYAALTEREVPAYKPVIHQGLISRKRIAKGKAPLYDWTTVIVDPIKPIPQPPKGGTHASPRQHDVRGHQVRSKLGKVFWRKPHKRGDPSKGVIFHDYKVKGADDGRQAQ